MKNSMFPTLKRSCSTKSLLALALAVLFSGPSQATLIDRGNSLIYDDVLDITWLQDASLGGERGADGAKTRALT